jgi:divalent metal cation (Fe/Co/Zn/Cd) transporter
LRHPELDGAGSIAIGLILAATSIFLARESKSLLIGEQAYPSIRESILAIANAPTDLFNGKWPFHGAVRAEPSRSDAKS